MQSKNPKSEYDSPWKSIISTYFERFMRFFFPDSAAEIDWLRGFESLDTELEQVMRRTGGGKQIVDKLIKVWLLNGEKIWILIHIEVQASPEVDFPNRMFSYWSTIRQYYNVEVFSCAILADDRPNWRPNQFETGLWQTKNRFEFATVKLLDMVKNIPKLEENDNPFAQVVVAHLRSIQTSANDPKRVIFKLHLFQLLYEKGYSRKMIMDLMVFIDWVMVLTVDLSRQFIEEITRFDKEQNMNYIPTWSRESYRDGERIGIEKGERIGIEKVVFRMLAKGTMSHAEIATLVDLPLDEIKRIDKERLEK